MNPLPAALKKSRCILHVDLDCFYCQVEQVRLGIPYDVPAAVQQWHTIIAVNYAARKAGIGKITSVQEAQRLCPKIKLLHVATLGPTDTEPKYHKNPDRNTHKVSLYPYREASEKIFKIFHKYCGTVQKVGTDESFMDVTSIVNQRLKERYIDRMPELLDKLDDQVCGVYVDWDSLGVTVPSRQEEENRLNNGSESQQKWSPTTWRDLQLALGAELAAEIRKEIFDTLNYTCSAGVAHYKVVAKLCSSKNKPNNQTVLRENARLDFMHDVPFKKIRNMGGKLGSEVGSGLEILEAGEIWKHDILDLQELYGESTGLYIYNICRGIDDEEVVPAKAPKSLMAAKSFTRAIRGPADMQAWFSILAVELHKRIIRHYDDFGTWPKNISIRYATAARPGYRTKSIGSLHKDEMKTHENLMKRFQQAYNAMEDGYPCIGIDLMANGLVHDESSKSHTLNRFFTKSIDSAHDANGIIAHDEVMIEQPVITKKKPNLFFSKQQTPLIGLPPPPISPVIVQQDEPQQKKVETWECDKCKQTILISELDEHTDYHFALDIQREGRLPTGTASPPTQSTNSNKKRKPVRKEVDKKKKLAMFFQPRSSSS